MTTIKLATLQTFEEIAAAAEIPSANLIDVLRWIQLNYESPIEIQIDANAPFITRSYVCNPSMLARNSDTKKFTYVRASLSNGIVIISYSHNPNDGRPFLGQLKHFLLNHDHTEQLEVPIENVPHSYASRPEQLRYRIWRELGVTLITRKSKANWIYRRAKN